MAPIKRYISRISRLRHYRGHGIHSPFVFSLVRNVLLKRKVCGEDILYQLLRQRGMGERASIQIQNLCNYYCYHNVRIDGEAAITAGLPDRVTAPGFEIKTGRHTGMEPAGKILVIYTNAIQAESTGVLEAPAEATIIVAAPKCGMISAMYCRVPSGKGGCMSVDTGRYTILFNDRKELPAVHYKL